MPPSVAALIAALPKPTPGTVRPPPAGAAAPAFGALLGLAESRRTAAAAAVPTRAVATSATPAGDAPADLLALPGETAAATLEADAKAGVTMARPMREYAESQVPDVAIATKEVLPPAAAAAAEPAAASSPRSGSPSSSRAHKSSSWPAWQPTLTLTSPAAPLVTVPGVPQVASSTTAPKPQSDHVGAGAGRLVPAPATLLSTGGGFDQAPARGAPDSAARASIVPASVMPAEPALRAGHAVRATVLPSVPTKPALATNIGPAAHPAAAAASLPAIVRGSGVAPAGSHATVEGLASPPVAPAAAPRDVAAFPVQAAPKTLPVAEAAAAARPAAVAAAPARVPEPQSVTQPPVKASAAPAPQAGPGTGASFFGQAERLPDLVVAAIAPTRVATQTPTGLSERALTPVPGAVQAAQSTAPTLQAPASAVQAVRVTDASPAAATVAAAAVVAHPQAAAPRAASAAARPATASDAPTVMAALPTSAATMAAAPPEPPAAAVAVASAAAPAPRRAQPAVPTAAPADAPIAVTVGPVLGRPLLSAALTPPDTRPSAAGPPVASTSRTPPKPAQPDVVAAAPSTAVAAPVSGVAAAEVHAATPAGLDKAHPSASPAESAAVAPTAVADAGAAGANAPAPSTPPAPATAAAPPPATPAPPAVQLAEAVSSIAIDTRGAGSVTVHLQPSDLGSVAIRVGSTATGTATVAVTVERSATLAALQADLGHLHQALDRAGVSENRSITLHLVTAAEPGRGQSGDQGSSQGFSGGAGAFGQGSSLGGSSQGGGQHGQPRPQAPTASSAVLSPDPMPASQPRQAPTRTRLAGVNITA